MNSQTQNSKPGWNTAQKEFYKKCKFDREELKKNITPAEEFLWKHIRSKKQGVKFRRQHIIDFYIPDFVALSIKLIIEVDGKIHLKQKMEDLARTNNLRILGYKVLRFTNEEVLNDIELVLKKIRIEIMKLTPPNLPEGEGFRR